MQDFIVSILTAIPVALVTTILTINFQKEKLKREFLTEYKSEDLARKLLNHPNFRLRTFATIQHHIGGFEDNELRQILVRAGAVRFKDTENTEIWGLVEKVEKELVAQVGTASN